MEARTSFNLDMQGPFTPKVTWIGGHTSRFAAVRLVGDGTTSAEVYITTREEADALIQAFTEVRDLLPEED